VKKVFTSWAAPTLIGFILLNIIAALYRHIYPPNSLIRRIDINDLKLLVIISFLFVLFGAVTEWQRLLKVFEKKLSINRTLLAVSILLADLSLIPFFYWVRFFRIFPVGKYVLYIFSSEYVLNVISFVSGILIVRALAYKA